MILLLFYNATTVCLFVLDLRGWEFGGGMLCGIVGHFQIIITSYKSASSKKSLKIPKGYQNP
jgi:hypothetical protein